MIYTCYDMIRDCRDGKPEGWSHFVTHYVPAARALIAHYFPAAAGPALLENVLKSGLFRTMTPAAERAFLILLRAAVLAEGERATPAAESSLDLETLTAALESLTLLEKQVVWFETSLYAAPETARMLKMDAVTVNAIRLRAGGLLREKMDRWSASLLADQSAPLRHSALQAATPECLPAKEFLDVIDGRATWLSRDRMDRHASSCWHCIDHFCRLREVSVLRGGRRPLDQEEATRFLDLLGVRRPPPSWWKRLFRLV